MLHFILSMFFLLKLIIKKIYLIHHPLKYGEAVKILTPENKAPSQKLLSRCLAQKSNWAKKLIIALLPLRRM